MAEPSVAEPSGAERSELRRSGAVRPTGENLPANPPPANHGRTGAGWALFAGGAIAALVAAIGFILLLLPLIIAGAAVAVLSIIVSAIMRAVGYGQVERIRPQE